jgi:predicted anti-sigma-YlaC factor YlaD
MAFTMNPNKDCVLAWEAMPDALQDALTPQQRAWLEAHLAGCGACRGQFAQQQRLQRAMSLPTGIPVDMEAGLQRLLARIDNPDIAATPDPVRPSGWMGRAVVAAVLLQAIGLGVMGT